MKKDNFNGEYSNNKSSRVSCSGLKTTLGKTNGGSVSPSDIKKAINGDFGSKAMRQAAGIK